MTDGAEVTMSSPQGIAIVVAVVLLYLAVRLLPRLLAGWNSYVSPREVKQRLDARENILLLDVRSPGEFVGELGHLPGAVNVPLSQLKSHLGQPDFLREWRGGPVIAVCRSDSRAAFAVRPLKRAGFTPVFVMSGGMVAWMEEAFPVERANSKSNSV